MSAIDLDTSRAIILPSDFTASHVERYTFDGSASAERAATVCTAARQAGVPVTHVMPDGYRSEDLHPSIALADGDSVVFKHGVRNRGTFGAFATTDLDDALRRAGKDVLVLMGIATSGTVLSTTRWAYDLGYTVVVVADACSDPDPDVHRLLTERVHETSFVGLWRQAEIVTTAAIVELLATRP